jgi:hypothetical protein
MSDDPYELFPPYPKKEHNHPADSIQEIFGILDQIDWGMPRKSYREILRESLIKDLKEGFAPEEQEQHKDVE